MSAHVFMSRWRDPRSCNECGMHPSAHLCLVGSLSLEPCKNVATHISGACHIHAPRVCAIHPSDDGRDGFCGACLDDYQARYYGEEPETPLYIEGPGFVLVGAAFQGESI